MNEVTKIEETLLLAIWQLKDNAYGYKIRKHISKVIKKDITYGNLYSVLNQLARRGYVQKTVGESTEKRQGKNKIYYTVTPEGLKALKATLEMRDLLWDSISRDLLFRGI